MKRSLVGISVAVAIIVALWTTGALTGSIGTASAPTTGPASSAQPAVPATQPLTDADVARFFRVVDTDQQAAVAAMLKAQPELVRVTDEKRNATPLHHARSVAVANLLLEAGADANARDSEFNARPVRWMLSDLLMDSVELLESVAGPDDDLAYDIAAGHLDKVKERLAANSALATGRAENDVLGSHDTYLHMAAAYNRPEACELLLAGGADVDSAGSWSNAPPLEYAAWQGFPETVKVLLAHGAKVNAPIKSPFGTHTAIWWAATTGRTEVVRLLLDAGATVEPSLISAVKEAVHTPPPGRALPGADAYGQVVELLTAALEKQKPQPPAP